MRTAISATGEQLTRGFTLIEMLVVLVILVGFTAAFPLAWERLSPQRQVQLYARSLLSDLQRLRAKAMSGNGVSELDINATVHGYLLAPEGLLRTLPAAIDIRIVSSASSSSGQDQAIRFFPDGSSNGGEIFIERAGRNVRLVVSQLSGRVSEE